MEVGGVEGVGALFGDRHVSGAFFEFGAFARLGGFFEWPEKMGAVGRFGGFEYSVHPGAPGAFLQLFELVDSEQSGEPEELG